MTCSSLPVKSLLCIAEHCLNECERMSDVNESNSARNQQETYRAIDQHLLDILKIVEQAASGKDVDNETLARVIILCAIHTLDSHWTCQTCIDSSKKIQQALCDATGKLTTAALISNKDVSSKVLKYLCVRLSARGWESKQCLMDAFAWVVVQVAHPRMSGDVLDMTLSVALVCVDCYVSRYKVRGVRVLRHVLRESDNTEIMWLNRCDVIYDALYKCLYIHDAPVVDALHPALLAVLRIKEDSPPRTFPERSSHAIVEMILKDMGVEDKWALRRSYSRQLREYIGYLGITSVKHLPMLWEVFDSYLSTSDPVEEECRVYTLQCVECAVRECWPVMGRNAGRAVKCVYNVLYDVTTPRTPAAAAHTKLRVLALVKDCLVTLKLAAPRETDTTLAQLLQHATNTECRTLLQTVLSHN